MRRTTERWRWSVRGVLAWIALAVVLAVASAPAVAALVAGPQDTRAQAPGEGGIVRGTVLGAGDRPLSFARLQISGNGVSETILTREDGTFEAALPRVGTYTLRLDAPGYRPSKTSFRIEQPGQIAAPVVRMTAISLRVRVFSSGATQPLAGVSVTVTSHDGGEPLTASTDSAGDCYFGGLHAGLYAIKATLIGYEPSTADVAIGSPTDTAVQTISLSKGSSIPVARSKQRFGSPRLPSDEVRQVFQDSSGYVWFATDRGVARFDGANLETSATPNTELSPLDQKDVRCIAEASEKIWFGTSDGLWAREGVRVRQVVGFEGQTVHAIAADTDGVAWIASTSGLFRADGSSFARVSDTGCSSIVTDSVDGSLWVVADQAPWLFHVVGGAFAPAPDASPAATEGAQITSVARTRAGEFFVGTRNGAFRHGAGGFEPFLAETRGQIVTGIVEDLRGNVWFATDRRAVVYDTRRGVTNLEFEGERINGLTNDREGDLWFATEKGAIRRDLYSFVPIRTSDGLINNNVTWMLPDRADDGGTQIWFVTPSLGSIQKLRPAGSFELVEAPDSQARVNHMFRDHLGQLWIATTKGLFLQTPTETTPVSTEAARWVAESPDGQIWVATEKGVQFVSGKALEPVADLARYEATRVFALGDSLWLATDDGAVRYVPSRRTVESIDVSRGVQGEAVRWVALDRTGRVWLASDFGVEILDPATFKKVDGNGGVNSGTDARTLMLDVDGFMWIGTAEGSVRKIAFYDGGVIETVFTSEQGIAGSVVNAIVQDPTGTIWIATDGGATQHLPTKTLPTLVVRMEVDGREFDTATTIPAGQHTIRFVFHGISMLGDVRYVYRLDADGQWQQLPPRQELEREVSFTDLGPGSHTFELRALNRDLYGIDAPPFVSEIRIDVHIWKKWWFYGLGFLLVTGGAVGGSVAYRYRTREFVLPPGLRQYVPIEPNPFIVGNPIRSESMFFGREDDFRYVRTKLEGASQGVVIVLCGDRRTGKSSILYQILNGRLGGRFIPVFVDLQEMVVANDREFFRRIARLIAEAVHLDRADVDRFGFLDETLNPYHQFVDFLNDVLERIGDRSLLLLMDEYELLEAKVDEGRLNSEIFLFLAGLMDSKERLSFVFTGSRRLEDRDRRYWREMLRRSLFRKIGFLSQNDARRLVTEPVADRVVYGRGVVDRIVRLTAGQPFYVQVICQTAVDYLNEHKRNALTMRDLDTVLGEIVDHPLPQMIYFWEGLSPDEKVVLALLSMNLDASGDAGWASAADIAALVVRENAPVDLSENTIHLTLEELFRTDVLEKSPFESYRFRIDLFRLWVRRSHSIWQVLKGT